MKYFEIIFFLKITNAIFRTLSSRQDIMEARCRENKRRKLRNLNISCGKSIGDELMTFQLQDKSDDVN